MTDDALSLREYFDHALRELYSLEEMLESFGQQQMADVLKSVVEMAYAKLCDAADVLERDVGNLEIRCNEYGEPDKAEITAVSNSRSMH